MQSQTVLQTGLAAGLSATEGFHSSKPNPMPKDHDNKSALTPSDFVPEKGRKVTYRGKKHSVTTSWISIGAWSWGDQSTFQWKPEELDGLKEAWQVLLKNGIDHIDTAQVYGTGESERISGELVKDMKREDFVMQTKYWVLPTDMTNIIHWSTVCGIQTSSSGIIADL